MNQLDQLNQYRATRIFSYSDARTMARRRLPRLVFDYMEGAAGDELAMARNRKALDAVLLSPRSLVDVDQRILKTSFLKQDWDLPFGIAPMGMCNLAGPGTDQHFASAATHHNIPLGHSTAASSNIESMAAQTGDKLWFQLYVGQSIELGLQLVQRAKDSGCQTLILTVDVPEVAQRLRDKRNGFKAPLKIGPKQFLDFAFHPQWSLTTLAAGVPELANFKNDDGSTQQFNREDGRGKLTWEFLKQLREIWKGNLVIKGIMHTDDARQAADHGVDAIYVSNHGGRQLDSAPASITRLRQIRRALGSDMPLIIDSGIRSGDDIVRAYASGASFVMVGRPFLFAAAAAGKAGVTRFTDVLAQQTSSVMAQTGVTEIGEISEKMLVQAD